MKNILITGASRGIGAAMALLFGSSGYNVILNYRTHREEAENIVKEIQRNQGNAVAIPADISLFHEAEQLFANAVNTFGSIDVLINNAGISSYQLFQEIDPKEWQDMFAVNVHSAFYLSKLVLPSMIQKQAGIILNMASIWGLVGGSTEVHYSATKGAIIAMTKALAKEVAPSGIRVNAIAPGAIDTGMLNLSEDDQKILLEETPLGRLGRPDEIAQLALYLCSDAASFITGQIISPNGGLVI